MATSRDIPGHHRILIIVWIICNNPIVVLSATWTFCLTGQSNYVWDADLGDKQSVLYGQAKTVIDTAAAPLMMTLPYQGHLDKTSLDVSFSSNPDNAGFTDGKVCISYKADYPLSPYAKQTLDLLKQVAATTYSFGGKDVKISTITLTFPSGSKVTVPGGDSCAVHNAETYCGDNGVCEQNTYSCRCYRDWSGNQCLLYGTWTKKDECTNELKKCGLDLTNEKIPSNGELSTRCLKATFDCIKSTIESKCSGVNDEDPAMGNLVSSLKTNIDFICSEGCYTKINTGCVSNDLKIDYRMAFSYATFSPLCGTNTVSCVETLIQDGTCNSALRVHRDVVTRTNLIKKICGLKDTCPFIRPTTSSRNAFYSGDRWFYSSFFYLSTYVNNKPVYTHFKYKFSIAYNDLAKQWEIGSSAYLYFFNKLYSVGNGDTLVHPIDVTAWQSEGTSSQVKLQFECTDSLPKSNLYDHGMHVGDTRYFRRSGVRSSYSTNSIRIIGGLHMFEKTYQTLYVGENGFISFGRKYSGSYGLPQRQQAKRYAIVAPYLWRQDMRCGSAFFYQQYCHEKQCRSERSATKKKKVPTATLR